jgi:hypothetical protein
MPDTPTLTAEQVRAAFTELASIVAGVDPTELVETVMKLQEGTYVDDGDIRELRTVLVAALGLAEVLGSEAEHFLRQQPEPGAD